MATNSRNCTDLEIPPPNQCFLCGEDTWVTLCQGRAQYLEKVKLFKTYFIIDVGPRCVETCTRCYQDLTAVWDLHQKIVAIRKDINTIVEKVKAAMIKNEGNDIDSEQVDLEMNVSSTPGPLLSTKTSFQSKLDEIGCDFEMTPSLDGKSTCDDENGFMNEERVIEDNQVNNDTLSSEPESPEQSLQSRSSGRKTVSSNFNKDKPCETDSEGDSDCTDDDESEESDLSQGQPKKKRVSGGLKLLCPHCPKTLTTRKGLKGHLKIHLRQDPPPYGRPFQCELCIRKFFTKEILSSHVVRKHSQTKFPCSICSKELKSRKQWAIHEAMVCQVKDWGPERLKEFGITLRNCPIPQCGKVFAMQGTLTKHIASHTAVRSHPCLNCGLSFTLKSVLKTHSSRCGPGVDLQLRRKRADWTREWKKKEKPFSCHLCHPVKGFIKASALKAHQSRHHSEPSEDVADRTDQILCDLCGVSMHYTQITGHRRRVHEEEYENDKKQKKYTCKLCGQVYRGFGSLRVHYVGVHGGMPDSKWECDKCNRKFLVQGIFEKHRDLDACHK